ncbi:hypothetical protein CHELA20_50841 [Hyphomicrobiales bacterium]|nr:hypothetical protein CHELA20_50841 [Hyphomicrobiales bacterium]CAH1675915.1 hypothetical protein CHELA41_24176 [Hyphomicrobiales bacterium]
MREWRLSSPSSCPSPRRGEGTLPGEGFTSPWRGEVVPQARERRRLRQHFAHLRIIARP